MDKLSFYYGTMGCSKSAQLIITEHNFRENGVNTQVIKPAYDTRFDADKIVSRMGLSTPATAVENLTNFHPNYETSVLFVDEVQFFSERDIDRLVRLVDDNGLTIMCYGLMVDSNEKIFPASRRLIEVGAKIHQIQVETKCQMRGCTNTATHHLRFDDKGNVIHDGEQFALGDGNYKSVCRRHFNALYHRIISLSRNSR